MRNKRVNRGVGSTRSEKRSESGELERPEPKRRKIDCGDDPVEKRHLPSRGDRRDTEFARSPSQEP